MARTAPFFAFRPTDLTVGFPDPWLTSFLGQLATEVSSYEVISFNLGTGVGCLLGQSGEAHEETTKYGV